MSDASWQDWRHRLEIVLRHVDWQALGKLYFHVDGERLLRARADAIVELGERWARAAARRLPAGGRSLWVGAGLGDLPAMLAERLLQDRTVVATNLRARECELLSAALRTVGLGDELAIVCRDAGELARTQGPFDHLAAPAVFTDPETWPVLSGVAYGRIAPVQVDVAAFERERAEARGLVHELWAGLRLPAWITTTAEEIAWFLEQAAAAGARAAADEELVPTAVVGDPIGFLRVTAG